MAQTEDNVARMRQFVAQIQAAGHFDLIDQFVHPDFCDHAPDGSEPKGRDACLAAMRRLHTALSDISVEILHCLEHDGVVATNKIIRGLQTGTFIGKPPTEPPQRVQLRVMDFVRYQDGLISDHWSAFNLLS